MITAEGLWPNQVYALAEVPRRIMAGERRICLTSPTGGGKTRTACGLIEWGIEAGYMVVMYTNRKLMVEQLQRVLGGHGLSFGVRASGHFDQRQLPIQISSLPTENSRVLKSQKWEIHGAGRKVLALIDEAHLNASATAQAVVFRHIQDGGAYVGLTATPIDLGHFYTSLVIAGTPSELRACGALVPAYHFGVDEPDMKGFKQNVKTGEYTEKDLRKAIMTKAILGRVLENYREFNAEGRPTILFGPGVAESIWFAEQLSKSGIRAAHIDGSGVWLDGEYCRGTDREEILQAVQHGEIKVLCNRFVLREGLDLPQVSHLILATVMGSLRTYLQSAGRGLRACEGKDRLTIQDHGGHWWRHGSVNVDRKWELGQTENIIRGLREESFREKREPEPIRCPECGLIRKAGPECPECGHVANVRKRIVIQMDGTLKEHTGDIFKPRRVLSKPNTAKLWTACYFRAKNSRNKMTFRQAEALFFRENFYWPPHDLPLMPVDKLDWFLAVCDVPTERLTT